MAEVLITLGIIGVVAAMTLPTLTGNYQKHVTVNKLKKSYTTLSQMFVMAQKDNGGMENWDFSDFGEMVSGAVPPLLTHLAQTYFIPYLDVLDDCGISCTKVKSNYKYLNDDAFPQFRSHVYYTMYLKDGSIIFLSVNNDSIRMYDLIINVDINGNKGPNVIGKDIFSFYLKTGKTGNISQTSFWGLTGTSTERETLLNDSYRGCNKNAQGMYCGALIQYDNWEISDDYPW